MSANKAQTAMCSSLRCEALSFHRNISTDSVVVMAVRAESALENEADIMPNIKHMPAMGDMSEDAIIGIILSGSDGNCMPCVLAYITHSEPNINNMKLIGKKAIL